MLYLFSVKLIAERGILVAVEKDRYKDVDAGIMHVVEIYMAALEELIAKKRVQSIYPPRKSIYFGLYDNLYPFVTQLNSSNNIFLRQFSLTPQVNSRLKRDP